MKMMKETDKKKIVLIALDFDPTAQKVAEEGFSLAKAMGAELVLMHVIADPLYYASLEHVTVMGFAGYQNIVPLESEVIESLRKESHLFLDKSKQHLQDESIRTLVAEGDFAEAILKAAKDLNVDIIVMGSHSRKWLEKVIMGSVTEKVLSRTPVPLFIVPTKKHN
jgi:nucleotide-binding universal stress UspA family protein